MATVHEKQTKLIVQYWLRRLIKNKNIPSMDIANVIFTFFDPVQILKFGSKYKSMDGDIELLDDNKCIKRKGKEGQRHILVDCEPAISGVHCWRLSVEYTLLFNIFKTAYFVYHALVERNSFST